MCANSLESPFRRPIMFVNIPSFGYCFWWGIPSLATVPLLEKGDNPRYTLPETNIAPESVGWLEDYFPLG